MKSPEEYLFLNQNQFKCCAHFINEIYKKETGKELGVPEKQKFKEKNIDIREVLGRFLEVKEPEQYDICRLKVNRSMYGNETHVGLVFIINRKPYVLHFTPELGIQLHTLPQLKQRQLQVIEYRRLCSN